MQTYDFIIVGAGSAGSVVAERLSASGRFSVLVLEAGGTDRRFFVQMPLGYGKTFYDPKVNWNFRAEPDPGLAGNADHWPRGKILGGSSSINAMVWIRGQPEDFDAWEAAGNPGWGYSDLLPLFKAVEDNEAGADEFRGRGGQVHISDNRQKIHPLTRRFLLAAEAAGLPPNQDFNGRTQEGAGIYQITTRDGRRMSAARAFLWPAMKRPSLCVETDALVTRVVFEGKAAKGVEYRWRGRTVQALAGREVILCAGAVSTPLLLQRSGVGPEGLLRSLGIAVLRDNPHVGRNLQDHLGINYTWKCRLPTLNQILRPWWGKLLVGAQYLALRRGAAVDEHEPRRGLLPHKRKPHAAEHAALLPGLLDSAAEAWRAADPFARSVARLLHRPFQLSADELRSDRNPLGRPGGAAEDRAERLLDRA